MPASGVAKFAIWVVEHSVAVELVVCIELALVFGSVGEDVLAVGFGLEVINSSDGLLSRAECFYFADRSALRLTNVIVIEHADWGLKLLHFESIGQVASMLIIEG